MGGHEVNGRTVWMLGMWEVFAHGACIGRVRALDVGQAVRRAAKKWKRPATALVVVNVLPTVYAPVEKEVARG